MFGEFALSERAIAAHGIIAFGASTADANFQAVNTATLVADGAAEMSAIAIKTSIGVGILVGLVESSTDFVLSSDLTRFATGISAQVINSTQTTTPQAILKGVSEQDFSFTQVSDSVAVLGGVSEQDFTTIQSALANAVSSGVSEMDASFEQGDATLSVIFSANSTQISQFDQSALGGLIVPAESDMVHLFVQSTFGELLWVNINASTGGVENWTPITHSGDTWTQINAGGTIEQWIEKVV